METTISFGYLIRRPRRSLALTQQAAADQVGCFLAALKKIGSDERLLGMCRNVMSPGRKYVQWWTHKIRGLHLDDFIMAAKTDALLHP